jgi:hypothetical protein
MTTISFVAGLLPLLIAVGPGAEERRSIAVLAVGGQTLSLLLTLLATPVIYSIFDDMARMFPTRNVAQTLLPAPHVQPSDAPAPQLVHAQGRAAYNEG